MYLDAVAADLVEDAVELVRLHGEHLEDPLGFACGARDRARTLSRRRRRRRGRGPGRGERRELRHRRRDPGEDGHEVIARELVHLRARRSGGRLVLARPRAHHSGAHLAVAAVGPVGAAEIAPRILQVHREVLEAREPVRLDVPGIGHLVDLPVLELEAEHLVLFVVAHSSALGDDRFRRGALALVDLHAADRSGAVVLLADEYRVSVDRVVEDVLPYLERRLHAADVDHEVREPVVALGEEHVVVKDHPDPHDEGRGDDGTEHPVEGDAARPHRDNLVFGRELAERHQRRRHHRHWYN